MKTVTTASRTYHYQNNDTDGAWGTVTQRCDNCGHYGIHDFTYMPEGGHETCRHCGHYESWGY